MSWINELKFDKEGLIPVVIQGCRNNEVLMVAYMNKEALDETINTGMTYFYSRSRNELWHKGETSGSIQTVKGIYVDCDMDVILMKVTQKKGACHMGYRSCFYRRVSGDKIKVVGKKVFDPDKVYKKIKIKS